jgi:hypothetical protein
MIIGHYEMKIPHQLGAISRWLDPFCFHQDGGAMLFVFSSHHNHKLNKSLYKLFILGYFVIVTQIGLRHL